MKCKMTSFAMTSLHVDLSEAAKCVDNYTTHIASLLIAPSHTCTKYKMATIFGLTYEDSLKCKAISLHLHKAENLKIAH